jgi:hypothetical protein
MNKCDAYYPDGSWGEECVCNCMSKGDDRYCGLHNLIEDEVPDIKEMLEIIRKNQ